MIVMRVIPFEVPTLERLGLPERLGELVEHDRGLVLVSGGGGSGKSSTMAALVHHINATAGKHIVTIESPIEFLHRDLNASVTQREVGVDTDSFASGLRAALRQDPDVILIGELHDAQTFNTALSAGETGQLVIASLPTPDPVTTIERAVSLVSTEEQDVMRARLAGVVHAIISQRLLPRADGEGRCAVCEVLVNVEDMPDRIRDGSRSAEIHDGIAKGSAVGMQTFEQHVAELVSEGVLSVETARAVTGVG